MSRSKNKKRYYKKTIDTMKKKILLSNKQDNIVKCIEKIEKLTIKIDEAVSYVTKKNKKKEDSLILNERSFKKFEIHKQMQLLVKLFKTSEEPIYLGLLFFLFIYGIFEIFCNIIDKPHIPYYVYTVLFSLSILYLCKINWKTIATLVSLFALIKYLFIHHQLSSYYTSSIYFDIYMLFITLIIFYFVFLIELILISIYLITLLFLIIFNSMKFLYYQEIKKNKILYIKFFFSLMLPVLPLLYWNNIAVISYLIFIVGSFILGAFFALINIKDKENANHYIGINIEESYIIFFIFKILDDINIKISKLHDNMTFMKNFSFLELNKFSKTFFVCFIWIWLGKSIGIIIFFDTYNYDKIFYETNNGYCTNLNDNDLTFKTNSYDLNLLLSYTSRDDGFLLKEGDFIRKEDIPSKYYLFTDKEYKRKKYYIYEIKCEHNYKKIKS